MTELEKYRKNIEKAREAYNNGNLKESSGAVRATLPKRLQSMCCAITPPKS